MNKWYVVTGGPATGKTTLLAELEKLGHTTLPEAARIIIDQGIAEGKTVAEIRADEAQFQLKILMHKRRTEKYHPEDMLTFFDRGMHDTLAYLKLRGFKLEKNIIDAMKSSRYKKVFLLEPLDTYQLDYARTETAHDAKRLNKLLYESYDEHGMTPIMVPALPVRERVSFVLNNI